MNGPGTHSHVRYELPNFHASSLRGSPSPHDAPHPAANARPLLTFVKGLEKAYNLELKYIGIYFRTRFAPRLVGILNRAPFFFLYLRFGAFSCTPK